ncbi:hypothetical protein BC1002_6317 [Paraburkholderia atlantica]|uniref:Uncharacterized protein n=1 Tax=Paraburkholderia atlantica TaxID=2654982 RepID=D5WLS8_PARAM|nr:hypothetical protein BC1002_6317 [Paraburkholderia atlantica]
MALLRLPLLWPAIAIGRDGGPVPFWGARLVSRQTAPGLIYAVFTDV